MRRLVLLVAVALWPLAPAAADDGVAFRFGDSRITESSGLVDTGADMFTVNDSGNDALLFSLDPRTGRVRSTVRFADRAVDVEALALDTRSGAGPRPEAVWVGDIGDNTRTRSHIDLYRVDLGTGAVVRRQLRYPDGAHDAEALLIGPKGRVFVVTKGLTGAVYAAPPKADVMRRVGAAGLWITDGALMPDGRHALLRDYGKLHLFTFPGFERLASMRLPKQPQGEGLSVSPGGRIRNSSEGADQPVLEVELSARMKAALARATEPEAPATTPDPATPDPATPDPSAGAGSEEADRPTWTAPALGALVVVIGLAAWWRRRRR